MLYSQHWRLLLLVCWWKMLNYFIRCCDNDFCWCKKKSKDKDWRSSLPVPQPTNIKGQMVERVCSYRYLGITIDKMRFDVLAEAVCLKRQKQLHSLQRFSTCNISRTLMSMYYNSYTESVFFYFIYLFLLWQFKF